MGPSRFSSQYTGPTSKWLLVLLMAVACGRKVEPPAPDFLQSPASVATGSGHAPASPEPSTAAIAVPAPADVGVTPRDASKTASGLAYQVLEPGVGHEHPLPRAKVILHYTGWTAAGRLIDSTSTRAEPAVWRLNEVIKGWKEGIQLMTKAQKMRFWIPADLAYGDRPRRNFPAGNLVYDMELVDFVQPPAAPPDVKAPPPNARRMASGIAYRVLRQGTGTRHPDNASSVRVNYSGWTTDGESFESTFLNDRLSPLRLQGTIAGLSEGVQRMVEGEKIRLWIPRELAYGNFPPPGRPVGMLVYDIELLGID